MSYYPRYGTCHGWPWAIDHGLTGSREFLDVPCVAHHLVPKDVCELLRISEWRLSCAHIDGEFDADLDTLAGTFYLDLGLGGGVVTGNSPGWLTQQHVIERRMFATPGQFSDGMLVGFFRQASTDLGGGDLRTATFGASVLLPRWDWDGTDPIWRIPALHAEAPDGIGSTLSCFGAIVEFVSGTYTVISSTQGMTFLGETIGTPDPDWTISLEAISTF